MMPLCFIYFTLGGIYLIMKSVWSYYVDPFVPVVQIFALRLWAVFLNWEVNKRNEEIK